MHAPPLPTLAGSLVELAWGQEALVFQELPNDFAYRPAIEVDSGVQLTQGSVVELEALAGEPMDVLVNGYLIAQGEVVVVNEKFGIRLTDVVTPSERMRRLSRS